MMENINVIIRTADQTRKAEVTLNLNYTGADIIQASVENWNLPLDTDYSIASTTNGKLLSPSSTLKENGVHDGDILEIQPVLVAG